MFVDLRARALALAALSLTACGPAFTAKVSGYSLQAKETLFTPLTDTTGAYVGGLILVSDQTDTCTLLAATKAPPDATFAAFAFARRVDGKQLAPDVGDYTVSTNFDASSGSMALSEFIRTDANGTDSIPMTNRYGTSGKLSISQLSLATGSATGNFDGKFGAQNDTVQGALVATTCAISSQQLGAGFLGAELNLPSQQMQPDVCRKYISCLNAFSPGSGDSIVSAYGPNGSCWSTGASTAQACTKACQDGITSLRSQSPSSCTF